MERIRRLLGLSLILLALVAYTAPAASASSQPLRLRALGWAEAQRGKPYEWGGTGPYGFDCSGLVYEAYLHNGVNIGRDTYDMLAKGDLIPETAAEAQRGDLAFYGSGHVELVTKWRGVTFGAQEAGTLIGWHATGPWWHPTMYFRVR